MVNAFWLDRDPGQAAEWLVDRHVTSSVFECSMVLTTAAQLAGYEGDDGNEDLYFTHADHPLTRWAASSLANWRSLRAYTTSAHEEWRYRWEHGDDEVHGAWATARTVDPADLEALSWPETGCSDPPQVTGPWRADDYVDAYRLYYANEKRDLFAWSRREEPPWLDAYTCPGGVECPPGAAESEPGPESGSDVERENGDEDGDPHGTGDDG